MSTIAPTERDELAALAGISSQYLYQCLTGRRDMDAAVAARVERDTGLRLRRWHLRRDWREIWPEMVGVEGAPGTTSVQGEVARVS